MAEKPAFQLKSHLFSVHNLFSDRIQTFIDEIAEFGTKRWHQLASSRACICKRLKVHKIENFFGSDFEFCTISLLVMFKY